MAICINIPNNIWQVAYFFVNIIFVYLTKVNETKLYLGGFYNGKFIFNKYLQKIS